MQNEIFGWLLVIKFLVDCVEVLVRLKGAGYKFLVDYVEVLVRLLVIRN
ncbi:MAG: hypothetical protein H7068_01060 [Pedobacter sp.]|nr:hypothetical protein [Chitinophagaceae bacterium]